MTKMTLYGELRSGPQFDARGLLFRWEPRDVKRERVRYGTDVGALLATVIDGCPATEYLTLDQIQLDRKRGTVPQARHEYRLRPRLQDAMRTESRACRSPSL